MNNEANPDRPDLTPDLTAGSFAGWYWLKAELVAFCRTLGLPTTGAKRHKVTADLPTVAELGYPGFENIAWFCTSDIDWSGKWWSIAN